MRSKVYRLMGADGRVHDSSAPGVLGGNGRGKIYGRLDCPAALRALERASALAYRRHRVFFADEATATAAGFRPCCACMRTAYRAWRASIG